MFSVGGFRLSRVRVEAAGRYDDWVERDLRRGRAEQLRIAHAHHRAQRSGDMERGIIALLWVCALGATVEFPRSVPLQLY